MDGVLNANTGSCSFLIHFHSALHHIWPKVRKRLIMKVQDDFAGDLCISIYVANNEKLNELQISGLVRECARRGLQKHYLNFFKTSVG